ncbi:MAG: glycosyltransferase family 2 protein [Gemmatales bacterium]
MAGHWVKQQVARLYHSWAGDRPHARPTGILFQTLSVCWRLARRGFRLLSRPFQSINIELDEPFCLTGCGSLTGRVTSRKSPVASIEASVNGTHFATATPAVDGSFRLCPVPGLLPDGPYEMRITVRTVSGQESHVNASLLIDRFTLADSAGDAPSHTGSNREYIQWLKLHDRMIEPVVHRVVRILIITGAETLPDRLHSSLQAQTYPHWQWLILSPSSLRNEFKDERIQHALCSDEQLLPSFNPNAELILHVPDYHTLHPQALAALASHHVDQPADAYYFSDDEVDAQGQRHSPRLKPAWSPVLARKHDYLGETVAFRSASVPTEKITLRDLRQPAKIILEANYSLRADLIPGILIHRHDVMKQLTTVAEPFPLPWGQERTLLATPRVSIVIPTKDQPELLQRCISSIRRYTSYPNYEIVVIDNGSTSAAARRYLSRGHADQVIRVEEPFNHSRLNNLAARQASGTFLLLLNDDTEVLGGDWLRAMLAHAMHPQVGAVGAWLDFPDGTIQHMGITLDAEGISFNLGGELLRGGGQLDLAKYSREVSAVTGACLLISKERFLDVGGLDEVVFPTSYNDVDLCLRLAQQGLTCILEPEAHLLHHESASRKNDEREAGYRKAMQERWGTWLANEKYRHPLLSNAQDRAQGLIYHWFK